MTIVLKARPSSTFNEIHRGTLYVDTDNQLWIKLTSSTALRLTDEDGNSDPDTTPIDISAYEEVMEQFSDVRFEY